MCLCVGQSCVRPLLHFHNGIGFSYAGIRIYICIRTYVHYCRMAVNPRNVAYASQRTTVIGGKRKGHNKRLVKGMGEVDGSPGKAAFLPFPSKGPRQLGLHAALATLATLMPAAPRRGCERGLTPSDSVFWSAAAPARVMTRRQSRHGC